MTRRDRLRLIEDRGPGDAVPRAPARDRSWNRIACRNRTRSISQVRSKLGATRLGARTIASILEHQADRRGDSIAVDDGATRLTYAELIARARSIGDLIAPLEGPIGILLPVSTEYIVAIVATLLAGKAYVPMDESFPEKRNLRIVGHSGMTAVIVDARTAPSMMALDASVTRIDVASALERREDIPVARAPRGGPDDPIVTIFYTSGSTGEPKGVCQSEAALIYDIDEYIDQARLTPDDRVTLLYSPSVSSSNRDIYGALLGGARLCIIDLKALGLAAATAALRAHRVTLYHSVPGVFRSLFGTGTEDMDDVVRSIRWMRLNGDRVLPSDVALYKRVFPRTTGLCLDMASTETKAYASWMLDHDTPVNGPLVPVGYPRADLRVFSSATTARRSLPATWAKSSSPARRCRSAIGVTKR